MGLDHRKHKRVKAESDIFAAFVVPNEPIIVGRILDLSPGGVGVKYLATGKLRAGPTSINIFGMSSDHMERIQSTVIYDMEIAEESWSIPAVRRCGIKFDQFGLEGKTKWKEFLEAHSGGKQAGVNDRVLAPVSEQPK
jgi:hypothetical protein